MRQTTKKLTQELEKVGCELEPSKEESLLKWMGANARKNLAKCRSRGLLGPGRFSPSSQASWLLARSGRSGHNDQTKNYCNAHQLLQIRRFMEVKTCLFSNQKNSFPVSEQWSCTVRMRAICFSTMQWKQLESERMCLPRRAFAREAYSCTDKLRTFIDNTLRRRLSFPTLESATRERRLKWYQSMLARPSHHTIYLATLVGSFEGENVADFELNGSLSQQALPALRQLADDLTRLLPSWPGSVWGWVPVFLEQDFSGVSRFDSIPRQRPYPRVRWSQSLKSTFFEDGQGSNLHQCSECKAYFSTRERMFFAQNQGAWLQESDNCAIQRQHMPTVQVSFFFREVCEHEQLRGSYFGQYCEFFFVGWRVCLLSTM